MERLDRDDCDSVALVYGSEATPKYLEIVRDDLGGYRVQCMGSNKDLWTGPKSPRGLMRHLEGKYTGCSQIRYEISVPTLRGIMVRDVQDESDLLQNLEIDLVWSEQERWSLLTARRVMEKLASASEEIRLAVLRYSIGGDLSELDRELGLQKGKSYRRVATLANRGCDLLSMKEFFRLNERLSDIFRREVTIDAIKQSGQDNT